MIAFSILLVEDDESDVLFLKRAFRKLGVAIPIQVVRNGRQALDQLTSESGLGDATPGPRPTHVLLDLKLPEVSGFEVLEGIRRRPELQGLRVCILTSSDEDRDLRRAKELGADCYLVKPVSYEELLGVAHSIGEWVLTNRIPPGCRWAKEEPSGLSC